MRAGIEVAAATASPVAAAPFRKVRRLDVSSDA